MKMIKITEQDIKWFNERQNEWVSDLDSLVREVAVCKKCHTPLSSTKAVSYNDFLLDYGFLDLFNESGSPWQTGFWFWMEKKGYGRRMIVEGEPVWYVLRFGWNKDLKKEIPIRYGTHHLETELLTGRVLEYLRGDR